MFWLAVAALLLRKRSGECQCILIKTDYKRRTLMEARSNTDEEEEEEEEEEEVLLR